MVVLVGLLTVVACLGERNGRAWWWVGVSQNWVRNPILDYGNNSWALML